MTIPYRDKNLTIHERVTDLMNRLSIKEKVGQINQKMYGWRAFSRLKNGEFELTDEFKEHVAFGGGIGALYGIHRADPWSGIKEENGILAEDSKRVTNMIQRYIVKHSRFGIPALIVEECPHGHQALNSTSYPVNITKSSAFDSDMIRKNAELMAEELSEKGVHLALVSTLDLGRDPRWGRFEETFGEDSLLAKEYTEATIEGFQGDLIKNIEKFRDKTVLEIGKKKDQLGVILKHCIAQGDALGGHNGGSVNIGTREFYDIYQPLLDSCRNAMGVMAAYNEIDGVPCHVNQALFEENLRKNIGFQGLVMADGCALDRLNTTFGNPYVSAANSLKAGVDLSLWDDVYTKVEEGINQGFIDEEILDKAVYNVLSVKFLLGLFEEDFSSDAPLNVEEKRKKWSKHNTEFAEDSVVLLKNENILPISKDFNGKIAVIGPNGDSVLNMLGDYTPRQDFAFNKTIYAGVKEYFNKADVAYELGCEVRDTDVNRISEAVKLANASDIVILAIGGSSTRNFDMNFMNNGAVSSKGHNMDTGENVDLSSLSIGGNQKELYHQIAKTGKPVVSILIQGRPFEVHDIAKVSKAVLIGWYPGQMGGKAIANILGGTTSPSGRLSVSIPKNTGVLPVYHNARNTGRPDEYYDMKEIISYPFGHGLTYADVHTDTLTVNKETFSISELHSGETITVRCEVSNNSEVKTKHSSLLFATRTGGKIIQRRQELKSFKKYELSPKETKTLVFKLNYNDLATIDMDENINLHPCKISFRVEDLSIDINII